MVHDHMEEVYNMYGDCIDFFINMILFTMRNFNMYMCGT